MQNNLQIFKRAGYTLLETIMVIAIISSILLYTIAFQNREVVTIQVETEATQIQQLLQYAFTEHVETGQWPTEFSDLNTKPAWGGTYEFFGSENVFTLEYEIPHSVFPNGQERQNILQRIANLIPGAKIIIKPPEEGDEEEGEEEGEEEDPDIDKTKYRLSAQIIKSPATVPGGYQIKGMEKFEITYDQLPASYPKGVKTFSCDSVKAWKPFCVQAINFYDRDSDRLALEDHGNTSMTPASPSTQYTHTHRVPTVKKFGLTDPVLDETDSNIEINPELNAYKEQVLQIEDIGGAGSDEYRCQLNPSISLTSNQDAAHWQWQGTLDFPTPPATPPTNVYPAGDYSNKTWDVASSTMESSDGMKSDYLVIYGCCRGESCDQLEVE